MAKRLLGGGTGPQRTNRRSVKTQRPITTRQIQVLRLVAAGLHDKEIAEVLKITPSGAKKHLEALMRRYGVSGRTALVRSAIEAGDLRIRVRRPARGSTK